MYKLNPKIVLCTYSLFNSFIPSILLVQLLIASMITVRHTAGISGLTKLIRALVALIAPLVVLSYKRKNNIIFFYLRSFCIYLYLCNNCDIFNYNSYSKQAYVDTISKKVQAFYFYY
jgi:hypothetical protein